MKRQLAHSILKELCEMRTNKLSIWLSSIAIGFAMFAVGFACFRTTPMKADWMAILIGILAFITAILLAVQFFNYVFFNKEMEKKINKAKADIYRKNQEYMKGIINYSEGFCVFSSSINSLEDNYAIIYKNMVSAINHFCNYGEDAIDDIKASLNVMEGVMIYFKNLITVSENCFFNKYIMNDIQELECNNDEFISHKAKILDYLHQNNLSEFISQFKEIEKDRLDVLENFKRKRTIDKLRNKIE